MTHTGILIKAYRISTQLSQNALADKLKIHTQQISSIECGRSPCPIKLAKKLTKYIGVRRHEFRFAMSQDWFERFDSKWGGSDER